MSNKLISGEYVVIEWACHSSLRGEACGYFWCNLSKWLNGACYERIDS